MKQLQIDTIEKAFLSDDRHVIRAAVFACNAYKFDSDHFEKWWNNDNLNYKLGACFLARQSGYLPNKYIKAIVNDPRFSNYDNAFGKALLLKGFTPKSFMINSFSPDKYSQFYSLELLRKCVRYCPDSTYIVKKWLDSDKWYEKIMGLYSVAIYGDYHYMLFEKHLHDVDRDVRDAAVEAFRAYKLSPATILSGYNHASSLTERICWMKIAAGRDDVALPLFPNEMDISEIKETRKLRINEKTRSEWLKGSEKEKAVALYSLIDEPNPPFVVVNRALRDDSPMVLEVATIVAGKHGYPAHRAFNPGDTVYKKCVGNVIIEASIPAEAEVRGDSRSEGRSNMALITGIHGDFFGDPVGISFYDAVTQYRKDDFVSVKLFDYSFEDCTTGFHFFNDYNLARKFYY